MTDTLPTARDAVAVDPHLEPAHWARWLRLLDRADELRTVSTRLVAAGIDEAGDDRLAAAARLLRSTTRTVVVYGPSGAGKSTLLNALLGQDLLPVRDGVATTSVPVAVVPVAAGEPESCEVCYLTRGARSSHAIRRTSTGSLASSTSSSPDI